MTTVIYQASDLNRQGRAILNAARQGEARIRDTNGVSLLLLSEERVQISNELLHIASNLLTLLEALTVPEDERSPLAYGEWTWLRHLDEDDRLDFKSEILRNLAVALREHSRGALNAVEEAIDAWRTTAETLVDAGRKAVLLGPHSNGDYVEVGRPEAGGNAPA
jgi:hypothetical protein